MKGKRIIQSVCIFQVCLMTMTAFAAADVRSDRTETMEKNYAAFMGSQRLGIEQTDPELSDMMKKYIYRDITEQAAALTKRDQHLVTIAVLTTGGYGSLLEKSVRSALNDGVTPLEIRESVYHLSPYIGFPKVLQAMEEVNSVFREAHISLPLPDQGTTTDADRLEKGLAFQVATYGERINTMRNSTPENQKHLQDDLSAFCFGDIYTRKVLNLKTREMITVAPIGTLGNDEPQFISHIRGYLSAGVSPKEVIAVVTVMNPYVGFPRTLNNLRAVNGVLNNM